MQALSITLTRIMYKYVIWIPLCYIYILISEIKVIYHLLHILHIDPIF